MPDREIDRYLRQHPTRWKAARKPRVGEWDDGLVVKELEPADLDRLTDDLLANWHL